MKKILSLVLTLIMVMAIFAGCGNSGKYKDGSYEGVGRGASSDIKVAVEVKKGKIDSIKILEHKETKNLIDPVIENVIPDIIKKQTTEGVEAISGASNSSKGVIEAVEDALKKAKK
ncbi:FMN-binding protein [Desnuesiella massiliensis]|uniref:FMN-binding protein n=1 Tax=Desnuesiella massiliensis TaxID=1650662 RepID=UPI0006E2A2CD|nr:FMN-binding protein [Desnuesiella massiliensis]